MSKPEKHIFVCTQVRPPEHPKGCCSAKGGGQIVDEFKRLFEERGLWGRFQITTSGCLGPCDQGPNVLIYPEGVMYSKVTKEDVVELIDQHLLADRPLERLLTDEEIWG